MVGQVNGMNSSGLNELSMWAYISRLNGKEHEIYSWFIISSCLQWFCHAECQLWYLSVIRWYAKRFLHPDIVAPYDYIFIWDEDLGVEDFDPEQWVEWSSLFLVKRASVYHNFRPMTDI